MRLEEWPGLPPRRALLAGRDWRIVLPGLPHAEDDRAMELAASAEVLESDERGPCHGAAENHRSLRSPSNSARISRNGTLGPGTGGVPTRGRSGGVNQNLRAATASTASAKTGLLVSLGRLGECSTSFRQEVRKYNAAVVASAEGHDFADTVRGRPDGPSGQQENSCATAVLHAISPAGSDAALRVSANPRERSRSMSN